MPKRSIRLTDAIDQRIQSAAKQRGYSTPSAFLRAAIKKELNEPGEGSGANEKILGSIREVRQDVTPRRTCPTGLICFGGQLREGLRHLRARAAWGIHADRTRRGAKPPRPAAHQCGSRDAQ
jgi:Arc/MetJ-type ribon-helix-helix transcriptional regulator